jgi:hypothetical protein
LPRVGSPHIEIQGESTSLVVNPHVDTKAILNKSEHQGSDVDIGQVGSIEYADLLEMVGLLEVTLRSGQLLLPIHAAGVAEQGGRLRWG